MHVTEVAADLAAEQQVLDDLLSGVDDAAWATPTASPRPGAPDGPRRGPRRLAGEPSHPG